MSFVTASKLPQIICISLFQLQTHDKYRSNMKTCIYIAPQSILQEELLDWPLVREERVARGIDMLSGLLQVVGPILNSGGVA